MSFSDFLNAFYNPDSVIDKIKSETFTVGKTIVKVMIGLTLTFFTSALAFIGIIIIELYFLFTGKLSFTFELLLLPIYAAIIIPLVFWLFDTITLIIGIEVVGGKPNLIGILNIRALSIVPIPLKVLYIYFIYASLSLRLLISLPTNIISIVITAWSILLLIRGVHKLFDVPYRKAVIPGVLPFVVKAIIAFFL